MTQFMLWTSVRYRFSYTSTNQKETDMCIYQHLSTHESNENNESCFFFFDIVGKSVIHLFIYTL